MDNAMKFIRRCVVTSAGTTDDHGYMIKDYFRHEDNQELFFDAIRNRIKNDFFDKNRAITIALEHHLLESSDD
jgi:hypothetical protein